MNNTFLITIFTDWDKLTGQAQLLSDRIKSGEYTKEDLEMLSELLIDLRTKIKQAEQQSRQSSFR